MPDLFPKNNSSVVKDFRPSNFAFSRLSRLLSVFLIIALLPPAILIVDHMKVKAEKQRAEKASAVPPFPPPLPFTVSKPTPAFSGLAIFLTESFSAVSEFIKTPPKPEGLESAKTVSPASQVLFSIGNSLGSVFGFFSNNPTSNALLSPPPPAGNVRFDFDGDG